MTADPREESLPKWARLLIADLRREVEEARRVNGGAIPLAPVIKPRR